MPVKSGFKKYDFLKRLLDILLSLLGLIIFSPVLVVVALLVQVKIGSPILFKQQRPGKEGRVFTLYKFRTMKNPEPGSLSDADRLLPFGKLLRSTSLDELPELWNVLVGDMSLVGPRPLLVKYLPLYSPEQARRHEVRPGITGLAQVSGRNLLRWEDRFELDVYYVDNRSLMLDIKILFLTIQTVFRRQGISGKGDATMTEFKGEGRE
jgi:sugar transferase EpsL